MPHHPWRAGAATVARSWPKAAAAGARFGRRWAVSGGRLERREKEGKLQGRTQPAPQLRSASGVEAAERRVERARVALADIERQEDATRLGKEEVRRLERRRDEECLEDQSFGDVSSGDIDEREMGDSERLESVKAAAVSSVVGLVMVEPGTPSNQALMP
ncbi:hypothetical protein ABZP36_033770 [Zizania latifolia]